MIIVFLPRNTLLKMSFASSDFVDEEEAEIVFMAEEEYVSTEEPPMDEWSSLDITVPEENRKKIMFGEGLYDPGSGILCSKYIPMSDSAVFRHLYFNYPCVTDPGIKDALFKPEQPTIYPDDGQELYLALCKQMTQPPVRTFYKNLFKEEVDLKYYGLDPRGVRPMAKALKYNKIVKTLNLAGNFLSDDACYHLGELLSINTSLQELDLTGCRIKASGANRLFTGLTTNVALRVLKLSRNELEDDGIEHLAVSVFRGLSVEKIYLNYNSVSGRGISALAESFEAHRKFVVLDLSWNNLTVPVPTFSLLTILGESQNLEELNLSWCSLSGPTVGLAVKNLLRAPNLKYLILSNNRLSDDAITNIISGLPRAKKLVTLDLSYNPITPNSALQIILKMKTPTVKVRKILLDNVNVTGEFLEALEEVKAMEIRNDFSVSYGGISLSFKFEGPDMRNLVLKRANYLAMKPKKRQVDIALLILQLEKDKKSLMEAREFSGAFRKAGVRLDEDLIDAICNAFPGPRTAKTKYVDITLLADYVKRKWPDRKLPPTPPPEPEPTPVLAKKVAKGRKRKGKKK